MKGKKSQKSPGSSKPNTSLAVQNLCVFCGPLVPIKERLLELLVSPILIMLLVKIPASNNKQTNKTKLPYINVYYIIRVYYNSVWQPGESNNGIGTSFWPNLDICLQFLVHTLL